MSKNSYLHKSFMHVAVIFLTLFAFYADGLTVPEQIHLSYGDSINTIVVTWTTNKTSNCGVLYGVAGGKYNVIKATKQIFQDGGEEKRVMFIYRAKLENLKPNTTYDYKCYCKNAWSQMYSFRTRNEKSKSASFVIYGDLGLENPQSLERLKQEANEPYDSFIHVGDFAYDLYKDNGRVGDKFMNMIEPIAAKVPYMVCPGNHEQHYNFSNYRARFTMPNYEEKENLYYSWNVGPVHFISISSELYYFMNYGVKLMVKQYEWLVKDLEKANLPENRAIRPWIILYGHRPMYCSDSKNHDCKNIDCIIRVGLPLINLYGLEELLQKYGVDMALWGHEHSYERLFPVYDYLVYNGTMHVNEPYYNPGAPIHVTIGSAGNVERNIGFDEPKPFWSAFRSSDYGYTRMKVFNETHLYWEQISDDQDGKAIDQNWLVRDFHRSFLPEWQDGNI